MKKITSREGYIYIFSNTEYKKRVKIGRTELLPEVRAAALSKQTGAPGEYKLEWSQKVRNHQLVEQVIHHKLIKNWVNKEFFGVSKEVAIQTAEETIDFLGVKITPNKAVAKTWLKEKLNDVLVSVANANDKPIDRKFTQSWQDVIKSQNISFIKKAIKLCLKEGKRGDSTRRRFISYRSWESGFERLDLFFTQNHIRVVVKSSSKNAIETGKNKFPRKLIGSMAFETWKEGFCFNVSNEVQFNSLCKWLKMGQKVKRLTKGMLI